LRLSNAVIFILLSTNYLPTFPKSV